MFALKLWGSLLFFASHSYSSVWAFYCEFGICKEFEDCCGDNKCCKKGSDIWYYWAAAFLVVATIMVTACLYMRRFKYKHQSAYSYHRLQTDSSNILQT